MPCALNVCRYKTSGGFMVGPNNQVLDKEDKEIPGLYAAGAVTTLSYARRVHLHGHRLLCRRNAGCAVVSKMLIGSCAEASCAHGHTKGWRRNVSGASLFVARLPCCVSKLLCKALAE